MTTPTLHDTIITIRPESEMLSRQNLPYFVGVSGTTAGATNLSMNMVIIPPGGAAAQQIQCNAYDAVNSHLNHHARHQC